MTKTITGFSKFTKKEKIDWIVKTFFQDTDEAKKTLIQYWNTNQKLQNLHDDFTENTA